MDAGARPGRRGEAAQRALPGPGAGPPDAALKGMQLVGSRGRSPGRARTARSSGRTGTPPPLGLRPWAPPGRGGSRDASSPARRRSSAASASPPLPGLAGSPRRRLQPVPGRGWSSLSSARERLPLGALSLLLLHFSAPNAAAASCHRPSSQHGGGGGSGSCFRASRGLRELAPTFTATAPPSSSPARGHHVRHYGDHPEASREV